MGCCFFFGTLLGLLLGWMVPCLLGTVPLDLPVRSHTWRLPAEIVLPTLSLMVVKRLALSMWSLVMLGLTGLAALAGVQKRFPEQKKAPPHLVGMDFLGCQSRSRVWKRFHFPTGQMGQVFARRGGACVSRIVALVPVQYRTRVGLRPPGAPTGPCLKVSA